MTLSQWSQVKGIDEPATPANFLDWREASRLVQLATAEPFGLDLTNSGDPIGLDTWRVSEGFFETLGVTPMLGRTFAQGSVRPDASESVIFSHHLWQTRFGGDHVIGRTVTLDGQPYEVVGVLPPQVAYPTRKDLLDAQGVRRSRSADAQRHVLPRRRPPEARRHDRAGARGNGDHRRPPRANLSPDQQGRSGITVHRLFHIRITIAQPAVLLLERRWAIC